jgi:hypothetical protein
VNRAPLPVSKEEAIEAVQRDPATYEIAKIIPTSDKGGRPRTYPNWVYVLFNELISHFGTAGKTASELKAAWGQVRGRAMEMFPDDRSKWPPEEAIQWHHFKYIKYRYLEREDVVLEYRRVEREAGCELAREIGTFPGGAPRWTHKPTLAITTAADGTVIPTIDGAKPGDRRRDRATGKRVARRADPDVKLYHQGDGTPAPGLKFLPVHIRTPFGRVILDIPYVAGVSPKHEADVAMETLELVRPLLPGPMFHVNDGAMTGEHNQHLLTRLGIVLINMTRAKSNPKVKGHAIGDRVPDEGKVEVKVFTLPDGSKELLEVHQLDGQLGLRRLTDTGDPFFEALEVTRLIVRENRNGILRFAPYVGLKLPPDDALRLGRSQISVAIHSTAQDDARGFKRAAHVRMIGPGSPYFWMYRKMRGDSESLNRDLKDSLYRHSRAHSRGWRRQQVDMLGFAGFQNALTRFRFRKRLEEPGQ